MLSALRSIRPSAGQWRLPASGLSSALLLLAATATLPALAQADLRSTFPGRRVGGATRGECAARLIVHLVPANSVLAPGTAGIGLVMGPSPAPRPLRVDLRPLGRGGAPDRSVTPLLERTLPAAPAGITLLSLAAVQNPAIWESAYVCADAASAKAAAAADPLSFVESAAPPALSLLVRDSGAEDQRFQAALRELRRSCGSSVASADLAKSFELGDLLSTDWPARLPVSCP
ncbi:MAG: hypothetical protein ACKOZT_07555 [Cyanobium sp.]